MAARIKLDMYLDHGAKQWLMKTARKHFWRVQGWYDFEDLVQDGYVVWYRIVAQYCRPHEPYVREHTGTIRPPRPDAKPVTDKPHIMTLFKQAYIGHIHRLAKNRTATPEVCATDLTPETESHNWLWDRIGEAEEGDVSALIAHAPEPARAILMALMTADPKKLRAPYRVTKKHGRETPNQRLCKLAGLPPTVDAVCVLREYLAPA